MLAAMFPPPLFPTPSLVLPQLPLPGLLERPQAGQAGRGARPALLAPLPTPLPLHLWQAWLYTQSWPAALIFSRSGSGTSNSSSNNRPAHSLDQAALLAACLQRGGRDFADWRRGLSLYSQALRPARPQPAPIVWQRGTTVIRDYNGPLYHEPANARAPIILAVPSLVNRAGVLDLLPGRSLLRHLARRHRVWLLDWQAPGEEEAAFDLGAYVMARLLPALAEAQALGNREGRPVYLLGYCLGGVLALAAAAHACANASTQPPDGLILLATPWDFSAYGDAARAGLAQWHAALAPWLAAGQALPPDILQLLFNALQPLATYEKFRKLGAGGASAQGQCDDLFIAIEDWLHDGIPLAAPAARECLGAFFGANATMGGSWAVAGQEIDPVRMATPTLVVAPQADRLVPHQSAAALAGVLPRATLLAPPLGHIGMVVGRQAEALVWREIDKWIATAG